MAELLENPKNTPPQGLTDPVKPRSYGHAGRNRRSKSRTGASLVNDSPIMDGFAGNLARSSREQTSRIFDFENKGILGGITQVGKEIGSGLLDINRKVTDNVIRPAFDAAGSLLVGKNNVDSLSGNPASGGSGGSPVTPPPVIADPAASPTPVESPNLIGLNGSTPTSTARPNYNGVHPGQIQGITNDFVQQGNANILARGDEAQTSFNDENYQPAQAVANTPIQDPAAGQRSQQVGELIKAANTPIDNSLPYDTRKELSQKRDAAQVSLASLVGAENKDKDRASDYKLEMHKALLKKQEDGVKSQLARNKEASYFDDDFFEYGDLDVSDDAKLSFSTIRKSEGNILNDYFAKVSPEDLQKDIEDGRFDDKWGLSVEDLAKAFKAGHKLPKAS